MKIVRCGDCPCLQRGFTSFMGELENEWWFCGISESDLADYQTPKSAVKYGNCPLKRIELKDGSVYGPEIVDDGVNHDR